MKSSASGQKTAAAKKSPKTSAASSGKIHPVIIYPYRQPKDDSDLGPLFDLIGRLDSDKATYARPITVIDRKTHFANAENKAYTAFRENTVARRTDILDAWCVDTCQMWNTGLGAAFERGAANDVYWLIPGDFNYGTTVGHEVLGRLHDLPEICVELEQDICIGEVATDHTNSKQMIDTYGTFALLYTWFPAQAQEIRQYTERPRSEFLAMRHGFLGEILRQRWYAYEQTVVMLLQAITTHRRISQFFVGHISDVPEGRESFASALQQVERTERVLKSLWREWHHHEPGWTQRYRALEEQSEQVLRTALGILQNLLGE